MIVKRRHGTMKSGQTENDETKIRSRCSCLLHRRRLNEMRGRQTEPTGMGSCLQQSHGGAKSRLATLATLAVCYTSFVFLFSGYSSVDSFNINGRKALLQMHEVFSFLQAQSEKLDVVDSCSPPLILHGFFTPALAHSRP